MRRLAMADGFGLDPGNAKALFGWLGGLATATVGAIGLWLAQRVLGKAAFQTAINDGFSKLTTDLQEERDRLQASMKVEREAWAAERVAWSTERNSLQGEIRNLQQKLSSLMSHMQRQGMPMPEDAEVLPPAAGATILRGDGT